jgi:hypothetical protein
VEVAAAVWGWVVLAALVVLVHLQGTSALLVQLVAIQVLSAPRLALSEGLQATARWMVWAWVLLLLLWIRRG